MGLDVRRTAPEDIRAVQRVLRSQRSGKAESTQYPLRAGAAADRANAADLREFAPRSAQPGHPVLREVRRSEPGRASTVLEERRALEADVSYRTTSLARGGPQIASPRAAGLAAHAARAPRDPGCAEH